MTQLKLALYELRTNLKRFILTDTIYIGVPSNPMTKNVKVKAKKSCTKKQNLNNLVRYKKKYYILYHMYVPTFASTKRIFHVIFI